MATRRKSNVNPFLKELYEVNQILKKEPYSYFNDLNYFEKITSNGNSLLYTNESFNNFNVESFYVPDGSELYKFLKECKCEGEFDPKNLEILGSNDKVFPLSPYSKIVDETLFFEESQREFSHKKLSLYYEDTLVSEKGTVTFDEILEIVGSQKKIYGNSFLYFEIDLNNRLIVRSSKSDLDLNNEFFILDGSEFVKLKLDKNIKKHFKLSFTNIYTCILNYGNSESEIFYKLDGIFKLSKD